ncbi:MAG: aminoglycoside phosphotransferase family protein [Gammaproteobacteria bacterium]|nr:aminoglycoside phosphotransferase family protein [Gammaproteobacteria bacterium]
MNSEFESEIDIPLSVTKVSRIIEENSDLRVNTVRKLGEGLEFQSYLVNEAWVFRFPKHVSETVDPLAEKAFSQKLKLSISVPQIKYIWNHPWGYLETISGYEYLPGISLEHCRREEIDQDCLGRQLGTVLKELHTMTGVADTKESDPLATLRTWSEDLDEQLGRISRSTLSHSQRTTIKSYFDQYKFDLPSSECVLIHGDLGADHILLDEQNRLTGIIDWSNHTRGCRYRDFAGMWRWGGDAFCSRVLYHYPIQPSLTEMAFVRVMGLVNCISRVLLVFEQHSDKLRKRAHKLLAERLSEITKKSPYEPLSG